MGFLDGIQEVKSSGDSGGNYMKLQAGANQFRIVGSGDDKPNPGFIQGMLGWSTNSEDKRQPHRWRIGDKAPLNFAERPKEFFAMLVWNYKESRIQILELTQAGLKRELMALASDKEDWGDPRKYDISITKSGEGLETTYAMTPKPPKPRADEINEAVKNLKVNMEALYDGEDPFEVNEPAPQPVQEPVQKAEDGENPF
jgi:hypothetical protein